MLTQCDLISHTLQTNEPSRASRIFSLAALILDSEMLVPSSAGPWNGKARTASLGQPRLPYAHRAMDAGAQSKQGDCQMTNPRDPEGQF